MANKKRLKWTLFAVLLIIIGGGIWAIDFYQDIQAPQELFEEAEGLSEEERAAKEEKEINEQLQENFGNNKTNILFLGMDRTYSRDKRYRLYRPDAIVLASIDFETAEVDLVSFPRDTLLWIAHRPGKDKVNASFYYGHDLGEGETPEEQRKEGFRYTVDTISEFLGDIPIQYYVSMDMDGMTEIVNALGGVEVDVEIDMEQNFERGDSVIQKGKQKLNGIDFLNYVRFRDHKAEKDKERAGRQQKAMTALLEQVKKTNQLSVIPQLYQTMKEKVDTNLSIKQISALALYAKKIDQKNIEKHLVEGEYEYREGITYYVPDENERKKLVDTVYEIELKIKR